MPPSSAEPPPPAVEATPAEPEPAQPVEPPLPLDAYPLERCAAITASVARRKGKRAAILERHELTEEVWARLERHWAEAIQKELGRGNAAMLHAFDAAYVGQLEEERGAIDAEQYARLLVAVERGGETEALAALDLPRGAMMLVKRVWGRRIAGSPALGKQVRRAVADAGKP